MLDYFGVASADVYGTSMGGRVATWVAVDAPRRLRRLILGCKTPGDSHSVERSRDVRLSLVATGQSADVLADLMYTPRVPAQPSRPLQHLG